MRRNDYVTFNALYTAGESPAEQLEAFRTLHELWTWSMSDPIGAFYGAEMHARLARAYPDFAAFIEDHRIVDSRGAVFYPTSETRMFLLDRALEGRAPRALIAEAAETKPAAPAPATSVRESRRHTPVRSSPAARAAAPARAPKANAPEIAIAPVTASETPAQVAAAPENLVATTAPVVAEAPSALATSVAAPVASIPAPRAAAVPAESEQRPIARESALADRGILLLVIGILGVGLLAVMLRTPKDTAMPSVLQSPAAPAASTEAGSHSAGSATVEPMRRAAGEKRAS